MLCPLSFFFLLITYQAYSFDLEANPGWICTNGYNPQDTTCQNSIFTNCVQLGVCDPELAQGSSNIYTYINESYFMQTSYGNTNCFGTSNGDIFLKLLKEKFFFYQKFLTKKILVKKNLVKKNFG